MTRAIFAIKSKIKNIVFLINLKAKKVFSKVLSRFKTFFRSKKSKKIFLGLRKIFFRSKKQFLGLKGLKNQLLGLKSQKIIGEFLLGIWEKNMRFPKKGRQKI